MGLSPHREQNSSTSPGVQHDDIEKKKEKLIKTNTFLVSKKKETFSS